MPPNDLLPGPNAVLIFFGSKMKVPLSAQLDVICASSCPVATCSQYARHAFQGDFRQGPNPARFWKRRRQLVRKNVVNNRRCKFLVPCPLFVNYPEIHPEYIASFGPGENILDSKLNEIAKIFLARWPEYAIVSNERDESVFAHKDWIDTLRSFDRDRSEIVTALIWSNHVAKDNLSTWKILSDDMEWATGAIATYIPEAAASHSKHVFWLPAVPYAHVEARRFLKTRHTVSCKPIEDFLSLSQRMSDRTVSGDPSLDVLRSYVRAMLKYFEERDYVAVLYAPADPEKERLH